MKFMRRKVRIFFGVELQTKKFEYISILEKSTFK